MFLAINFKFGCINVSINLNINNKKGWPFSILNLFKFSAIITLEVMDQVEYFWDVDINN